MVRRVQSGDQRAFRELMERHQAKVHSIIYGILHNREDAEDIAQQVFTKVFRHQGFRLPVLTAHLDLSHRDKRVLLHLRKRRLALVDEPSGVDTRAICPRLTSKLPSAIFSTSCWRAFPKTTGGCSSSKKWKAVRSPNCRT